VEMVTSIHVGIFNSVDNNSFNSAQRVITFHFISFLFVVSTHAQPTSTPSLYGAHMYMHAHTAQHEIILPEAPMHETSTCPSPHPIRRYPRYTCTLFRHPAAQACHLALGSAVVTSGLTVYMYALLFSHGIHQYTYQLHCRLTVILIQRLDAETPLSRFPNSPSQSGSPRYARLIKAALVRLEPEYSQISPAPQ
jgi:hypothetical protein